MEQGIYELPLNERLRTFMRIEFLFNRLTKFSNSKDRWEIRTTIHTLLEIYTILARTDVRREVLAEKREAEAQARRDQIANQELMITIVGIVVLLIMTFISFPSNPVRGVSKLIWS